MDVTCERCSTAYEFDDALVSERGTTVKCTNCGHQFKVRRPQPLGAPERWLVRTIDGRELEFRALRELQAAIAQAVITRDDVLSRGGSRPRRLGSIAELEPFFVSAGATGPSQSTSLGLGPRAPVISEGTAGHEGRQRSRTGADPAPSAPRSRPSTPQSPGAAASALALEPSGYRPSVHEGGPTRPPGRSTEVSIAIPLPRGPAPAPGGEIDPQLRHPLPKPAVRPPSVPPGRRSSLSAPPTAGSLPGVIVAPSGAPPIPPAPAAPVIDEDAIYNDTTRAVPRAPAVDDVSAPTTPFQVGTLLDPVRVRAARREDWSPGASGSLPEREGGYPTARDAAPVPAEPEGEAPMQDQHTASVPPLSPVRHADPDDLAEPRFSQSPATRRAGAARWIVGLVGAGMLVLAFVTVGRKLLVDGAPARSTGGAGESDARIVALLADGEKSLADGDLESAKEQFDKASVLGERDPRAGADLARLAAARADVEWLRVRLVAPGDPEQPAARRELELAAQRARKAADRAAELAPADPAVARARVDALRLAGDLAGARKLVGGISAASTQPDNALALAELDLVETKPDWPTVLDRLRAALSTDGNLGRARSMLVYALARSGDGSGARAELEHLGALARPHPLLGALRAYVNRTAAALDPNALPDAPVKPAGKGPPAPRPAEPGSSPSPSPITHDNKEPRERPAPEGHVAPSGPIDVSDLPGVKVPTPTAAPPSTAPPAPPAPPPASTVPAGVDTSDLPGFK